MALLYFDNFGGYATADMSYVWTPVNTPTITASGGRNGGPYCTLTAGIGTLISSKPFTASSTGVVGFAFYYTVVGVLLNLLRFDDVGTTQASLTLNADSTLSVVRSTATAVTDGTSALGLSINTWYYIEMKITIADSISAGTCEVRVNGATWITVATSQDLKATANSTFNRIQFATNSSHAPRLTDIYIDNGTTFLGDCTVSTLTISGSGTTNTLTTGTYADVDDTTPDTDSTYVESAVSGQLATFALTNFTGTAPTTIHAFSPWNLVRKTDGGSKTAAGIIRSSGVDYVQTSFNATDSYLYNTPIATGDPATGLAWTASGINALEIGIKVL